MSIVVDFVKAHEGCILTAYTDEAGILTIGYGHTGRDVTPGLVWTEQQAEDALNSDLANVVSGISKVLKTKLSEGSLAALTSLGFNIGVNALCSSHLMLCVNNSDWLGAAKAFLVWDHVGQSEVKGLLLRRLDEASLFLKGT